VLLADLIHNKSLNLDELDGFFAFVYIDIEGNPIHAARDKFGVKPLYKYHHEGVTAYSSEPVVLSRLFNLSVNDLAMEEFKHFRAPIFEGSYYDYVSQIEPGTCDVTGIYFDLTSSMKLSEDHPKPGELKLAIKKGIASRLVADQPVGLLLSKGIDSNLIRLHSSFQKFYTVGLKNDQDLVYLKSRNDLSIEFVTVSNETFREAFFFLRELRGEPLSVPNEVYLYLVAKRAREDGVKVLLSGEGADEFFGGYDRIYTWAFQKGYEWDNSEFVELYCYQKPTPSDLSFQRLSSFFESLGGISAFEKVRLFFMKYHLPVLFRRLDFALMAAGVEGREPLANNWVYQVAKRYNADDLMNNSTGKIPLRLLVAENEGEQFAFAEKVGFPVDLKSIFSDISHAKTNYETWYDVNLTGGQS